jgi:RimJ/RimL family protein N-acetyltransferase
MPHEMNALGQPVGPPVAGWIPPIPPPREHMIGQLCRLEPLDAGRHAAQLFAANAIDRDGYNWTYLPYGPFETEAAYTAWVTSVAGRDDPQFWAIVDLGRAAAVGVASYLRVDPASGSIEVGHINYSPLLQRRPAATEAMYLMMQRAFALGYRRYEWKCDALNAPSRAAAVRLGFHFEGIFRQATLYKGRSRDTAWFSILDREWPEVERAHQSWLAPDNFDGSGLQRSRLSDLTRNVAGRGT